MNGYEIHRQHNTCLKQEKWAESILNKYKNFLVSGRYQEYTSKLISVTPTNVEWIILPYSPGHNYDTDRLKNVFRIQQSDRKNKEKSMTKIMSNFHEYYMP